MLELTHFRILAGIHSSSIAHMPNHSMWHLSSRCHEMDGQRRKSYPHAPTNSGHLLVLWLAPHQHLHAFSIYSFVSTSSSSPVKAFLLVWIRSCRRSRAAFVLARLASISSLRMRSRCFSALALWMCSTNARLCLNVLPLLRW